MLIRSASGKVFGDGTPRRSSIVPTPTKCNKGSHLTSLHNLHVAMDFSLWLSDLTKSLYSFYPKTSLNTRTTPAINAPVKMRVMLKLKVANTSRLLIIMKRRHSYTQQMKRCLNQQFKVATARRVFYWSLIILAKFLAKLGMVTSRRLADTVKMKEKHFCLTRPGSNIRLIG
jgi:hypothetical protein